MDLGQMNTTLSGQVQEHFYNIFADISAYNKKLFTDKKMHAKYREVLRHIIYDC